MTVIHLLSLFWSLPWAVKSWIAFTVALLGVGVWTTATSAGRAAAWIDERRLLSRAAHVALRPREWRVRIARRAPQRLIDRRAARLFAQMDRSGDDLEEADRERR